MGAGYVVIKEHGRDSLVVGHCMVGMMDGMMESEFGEWVVDL
jgi:hypothetical protein